MNSLGRLVILTGPSCVGKSPLDKALARFYPELKNTLQPLVLYNSRAPRPDERDGVDYHFRPREEISALGENDRFIVLDVRGDLQALDLDQLVEFLSHGDVFFEGNPFVARILQSHERLRDAKRLGVFMSPLSREEIVYLSDPQRHISLPAFVTDVMRHKLLRRTRRQKGKVGTEDLAEVERRAESAYGELKDACHFDYVIPNHDGEDSDNWTAFECPIGDARKALRAFVLLLKGELPPGVEKWEEGLLS